MLSLSVVAVFCILMDLVGVRECINLYRSIYANDYRVYSEFCECLFWEEERQRRVCQEKKTHIAYKDTIFSELKIAARKKTHSHIEERQCLRTYRDTSQNGS